MMVFIVAYWCVLSYLISLTLRIQVKKLFESLAVLFLFMPILAIPFFFSCYFILVVIELLRVVILLLIKLAECVFYGYIKSFNNNK